MQVRAFSEKEASNYSGVVVNRVLLLSLFAVCNKSARSSDVGFRQEGRRFW